MDITILFRACVKTVHTTNKALGLKESPPKPSTLLSNRSSSTKDVHLTKAKDIFKQLHKLRMFLKQHKTEYVLNTSKTLTSSDKDNIDQLAEKTFSQCATLVREYQNEIRNLKQFTEQKREHYENVVESITAYLKIVSRIYAEAKAIRVKRVMDAHKFSKLDSGTSIDHHKKVNPTIIDNTTTTTTTTNTSSINSTATTTTDELSAEEMQMFESENNLLYNELNTFSEEVQQMESKVVHISELQQLFTEKVLTQEHDIERISTNVVSATINVKDANEQIRQAIQRNAGLRVWVLFFLLVMSFSLLFLDWYND